MSRTAHKLLSASGGTEATDDDFHLVTQLYQFDGSNGAQNNTYLDSSSTGKTLTKTGSLYQGSFSPFTADEGTWGVEFEESNSDHLIMDHSDFTFGTGDYTIECFVFFTGNSNTSGGIFAGGDPNDAVTVPALALRDTTGLTIYYGTGQQKITGNTGLLSLGVWYHLAMVRASGVVRVYKDGALVTWDDNSTTVNDTGNITSSKFVIGKYYSDNYSLDGRISNFRVVKGSAVYTGTSFTPPTTPLTDITNTVLLTCRNNRFMDASSEANAVSVAGGTPKVKPFSPFSSSTTYTTAKGGSVQVPTHVAPNNLTIAATSDFAFGTGDYTLEAWVYPTDLYNSATIGNFVIDFRSSGNTGANFMYLGVNGSGDGVLVPFSGSAVSGIDKNAWNHIAVSRESGTERTFINGVFKASTSNTTNFSTNATATIASRYAENNSNWSQVEGYISNLRVVKGTAVYTSTFTCPTAPVGDITNTKLLANFTNAALFDQAGKTNLDTVGNTQLSTSVKKFGTASAKFDETGDTATIRDSLYLGGGDYTIEGFVYFNSAPTDGQGLFVFDSQSLNNRAGYGPALGTYAHSPYAGKWHSYYGTQASAGTGTQGNSETTPSGTTWIHFAYVRTSGVIKIFIDGSQIGSNINFSNIYSANNIITLGGYYSSSYLLNGYLDSWRVTLKARYTSNFTAPTKAFPNK